MKEDFGGAFSLKTDADSYSTEEGLGAKRNPKDLSENGGSSHDWYIILIWQILVQESIKLWELNVESARKISQKSLKFSS